MYGVNAQRVQGRMTGKFICAGVAAVLALGGCARGCPGGLVRAQGVQLFFGGSVAEADWADFAAGTLTAAYPGGFTTYAAAGQWRDPESGVLVRERTRVVQVFGAGSLVSAGPVAAAYRRRFHQQSVGVVEEQACAGF